MEGLRLGPFGTRWGAFLARAISTPSVAIAVGICLVICAGGGLLILDRPDRVPGSGIVVTETRAVSGVSGVELEEQGDLFIEFGPVEQILIEGEDNLLQYIETSVVDGILIIRKTPSDVTLEATHPLRYYLTVTSLESLTTTNSGEIEIGSFETSHFSVWVKSSGSVRVDGLVADSLDVRLTSSGNLTIARGQIDEQSINLSSSGSYDVSGVECRRAVIRLSSSGEADLYVLERLEAMLTSSGNVYYLGDPLLIAPQSSSTGRVTRRR